VATGAHQRGKLAKARQQQSENNSSAWRHLARNGKSGSVATAGGSAWRVAAAKAKAAKMVNMAA
jgi:hypothetical protein